MILPSCHYVYLHRRSSDGSIFYVGKGVNRRAWRNDNRNRYWHHIVSKHGRIIEIVKDGMTATCAMTLERIIINKIGSASLCNLSLGGEGRLGAIVGREQREKTAITLGRPVWNDAGELFPSRKHAARAMQARGYPTASHAGIWSVTSGRSSTIYGHAWSHESVPPKPKFTGIDAVRAARKIPVLCVETGERFASAADAVGRTRSNWVTACCKGRSKSAYGKTWRYAEELI